MRRVAILGLSAGIFMAAPSARADGFAQSNQLSLGVVGSYVPAQNDLADSAVGIGPYISYAHSFDFVYVGARFAMSYAWFPSGATGQQYVMTPDVFFGVQWRHKPIALKLEGGVGALMNGGEGFTTTVANHTFLRGTVQLTVVKSIMIEAFGGPSFISGSFVAAVYPEFGLGAGWNF